MAAPDAQSASPRRSRDSSTIGTFTKIEEIGRGSFATVYKAVHNGQQKDKSYVAIKSVNLARLNKKLKDNLTSEIAILKGLHHPHIVGLVDCKESTSHIHLIMEYVALGDLSYFIKKRETIKDNPMSGNMMEKYPNPRVGGLNEVVVRHFLQQLSSALQFLRLKNLIHRDVKPQNLLLNPSQYYFQKQKPSVMPYLASDDSLIPVCGIASLPMLKIADFGFARSLPSTSLAETLCGSPLYMAPEILRYEKYDAKADLWSVGAVLFEMVTGKPPFRASNHVELLRRIEKGEDKIKFPEDIIVSDSMKELIRSLLRRSPKERLSFPDFFRSNVIVDQIPGLVAEDLPPQQPEAPSPQDIDRRRKSRTDPVSLTPCDSKKKADGLYGESPSNVSQEHINKTASRDPQRQSSCESPRPCPNRRVTGQETNTLLANDWPLSPASLQRPYLASHATAPGRQELHQRVPGAAATIVEGPATRGSPTTNPSLIREQVQDRERERASHKQEKERAAQDIAFERDYVVVEKRSVEVNAFADELQASPRIHGALPQQSLSPASGAMIRRATTQGAPTSSTGAQTSAARAVQIASGRARPDALHNRQSSYERRYGPSPHSATSAISKALNLASGRLFGVGFSPPINLGRGSRSPPLGYNAFPAYPVGQNSLVLVGDGPKTTAVDEDTKYVQSIEEVATRSDVVYGFAEVKYRQLLPTSPSGHTGLGLRHTSSEHGGQDLGLSADDGLTVDAIVTVSEEALVLYVKALSLLAKSMDVAGNWWARKNRGEVLGEAHSPRSALNSTNPATNTRMNNVVQWVRNRFNEVLEKAEVVRLKLLDNQKRLPPGHPSHPNNVSTGNASSGGLGTSVDHVVVSSGITAEKLMYDRALEMSRSAAINELTGEDLFGCEISYVTAIRMLEAVLESHEDSSCRKMNGSKSDQECKDDKDDSAPINGMEAEDRRTVKNLVASIRTRLAALKKKLQVIQKRASAPVIGTPTRSSMPRQPSIPVIATTPPK